MLEKAKKRYNLAYQALAKVQAAPTLDDFQAAWADFLTLAGGVLHNLESGSNSTPQLRQWYGNVRRWARKEPFFRYMYQARNAEEHNAALSFGLYIEGLTEFDGKGLDFCLDTPGWGVTGTGGAVILAPGMMMATTGERPNFGGNCRIRPHLWAIRDEKHGNIYEVPTHIGGIRLDSTVPAQFGDLYLHYLWGLIMDVSP